MLWLWIVIIAEIASVIAGVWFYLKKVKGLELQLKQEAEARTQEALELAVAVEARKHLEEASERMLDDVKTLLLVRDQLHDDLDDQKQEIETLKKGAAEKINKIAIDTSSDLVKKLIGAEVNNSSISAIVDDLSKRNGNKYYGS